MSSTSVAFKTIAVPKSRSGHTVQQLADWKKLPLDRYGFFVQLSDPTFVTSNKNFAVESLATKKFSLNMSARTALAISPAAKRFKLDPESIKDYRAYVECDAGKTVDSGLRLVYCDKSEIESATDKVKDTPIKRKPVAKVAPMISRTRATRSSSTAVTASEDPADDDHEEDDEEPVPPTPTPPPAPDSTPAPIITGAPTVSATTLSVGDYSDIQVAFSYDTTGSMSACIERVKQMVKETIARLIRSIPTIQIAVIAHGDYCDEHSSYLMKYIDFTGDERRLCEFITTVGHTGGGDFEEAYEYVLHKARTQLSWSDAANRSLVMIGDATPHAPNYTENRLHLDWRNEARLLRERGVKVYAVRCLAWSESSRFYSELASITAGFYLELHQLTAVTDFMVAICLREGAPDQLGQLQTEIQARNGGNLTRNMRQLFATLSGVPMAADAVPADLSAVEAGRFQVLDVDRDESIREFVTRNGARFKKGLGFYEFMKPEEVQSYKLIVLMDKTTGDMFTGWRARELANIEDHVKGRKAKPPPSDKWTMFIQSTSYNRKLIAGTKFLYEASRDPVDD